MTEPALELELVAPVAGLPVGPATEATVRGLLAIEDHTQDGSLVLAINAANIKVCELPIVRDDLLADLDLTTPPPDFRWRDDVVQGATLLAARLFTRRDSTEGVAAFGDQGAVYIQRNDPDVAMLLRIGGAAGPKVG